MFLDSVSDVTFFCFIYYIIVIDVIYIFLLSVFVPPSVELLSFQASSLMIVCLLGHKTTLAPSLLNGWIRSVAGIARACEEAKDLHWFRLSLIALINLVQVLCCDGIYNFFCLINGIDPIFFLLCHAYFFNLVILSFFVVFEFS